MNENEIKRNLGGLTQPAREALQALLANHQESWGLAAMEEGCADSARAFRCGGSCALKQFEEGLVEFMQPGEGKI